MTSPLRPPTPSLSAGLVEERASQKQFKLVDDGDAEDLEGSSRTPSQLFVAVRRAKRRAERKASSTSSSSSRGVILSTRSRRLLTQTPSLIDRHGGRTTSSSSSSLFEEDEQREEENHVMSGSSRESSMASRMRARIRQRWARLRRRSEERLVMEDGGGKDEEREEEEGEDNGDLLWIGSSDSGVSRAARELRREGRRRERRLARSERSSRSSSLVRREGSRASADNGNDVISSSRSSRSRSSSSASGRPGQGTSVSKRETRTSTQSKDARDSSLNGSQRPTILSSDEDLLSLHEYQRLRAPNPWDIPETSQSGIFSVSHSNCSDARTENSDTSSSHWTWTPALKEPEIDAKPYIYSPLLPGQIRLLELHANDGEVTGRIVDALLSDKPEYETLSYAWGTGAADCAIEIDGMKLAVTRNLKDVLQELCKDLAPPLPMTEPERMFYIHERMEFLLSEENFRENPLFKDHERREVEDIVESNATSIDSHKELRKVVWQLPIEMTDEWRGIFGQLSNTTERWWYANFQNPESKIALGGIPRRVWIDAICINQADVQERSHQVKLMQMIYSCNRRLCIWLGGHYDDSERAAGLIKKIARREQDEEDLADWLTEFESSLEAEVSYKALGKFISRPWFGRSWVVQEYVSNAVADIDNLIICGEDRIRDDDMYRLNKFISSPTFLASVHLENVLANKAKGAFQLWDKMLACALYFDAMARKDQRRSLLLWLYIIRMTDSTDPRDKVYALLGFFESLYQSGEEPWEYDDYNSDLLIIDYNAKVQDVYASVVRSVVLTSKRLDIICASNAVPTEHVECSWIPDWSVHLSPTTSLGTYGSELDVVRSGKGSEDVRASGESTAVVAFGEGLKSMTVRGFSLDLIAECGIPITDDDGFNEVGQAAWGLLQSRNSAYPSSLCVKRESLYRTFTYVPGGPQKATSPSKTFTEMCNQVSPCETCENGWPFENFTIESVYESNMYISADKVFITESGYFGKVFEHGEVQTGDRVVILFGCSVPVVLREVDEHFVFVREVYIHGIMRGEAMKLLERGGAEVRDFELR